MKPDQIISPENRANPKTILLVEDEALTALTEQFLLQKHGFQVITAASGAAAVDIALRTPALDLILMDINLGADLDGTEAAQQILAQRDVPVVFLSCHTTPEVVAKTEKITSYGYVVKNSGETVLLASIKMAFKLFAAHQMLKEREAALQESEERFQAIADYTYDWESWHGADAQVRWVNPMVVQHTGYSVAECLAMPDYPLPIIASGDREQIGALLQDAIRERTSGNDVSFRFRRKDQTTGWMAISWQPVYNSQGRYLGIRSSMRNITDRKWAEEALRESQAKLDTLFHILPVGISLLDQDRNILRQNPSLLKILDITEEGVAKKSYVNRQYLRNNGDPMLPEEFPSVRAVNEHTIVQDVEIGTIKEDGALIWTNVSAVPLAFPDWKVVITTSDITDRKRAEEALRESEARFRRLAENSQDMIYRMSLPDGRYEYVSPACTALTGYTPEEVYALPKVIQKIIHPDWQGYFETQWAELLVGNMLPTYEYQIIHRAGKVKWLHQRNVLIRNEAGYPIAIEGIVIDITDRKRAEEALQQRTCELRDRVKKLNCLYGLTRLVEEAEMSLDTIFEKTVQLLAPAWQYPEITGARLIVAEHAYATANFQETRWTQRRNIIVHNKPVGLLEVCYLEARPERDDGPFLRQESQLLEAIAERLGRIIERISAEEALRENERQLRELNAQKDKFFAILAHDLRNPLVGFLSFARMLEEDFEGMAPAERVHLIQFFRASAEALFALLENLLTWSQLQRGVMAYCPQPLVLNWIAAGNVGLFAPQAAQKHITLTQSVPTLEVYGDLDMVEAIIRNLLSNAIKFTPAGGAVEITATTAAHDVRVVVADTGIGIPSEKVAQLFQIDGKTQRLGTAGETGTGLGLILCKEFVEKNGGRLWVESAVGKGTTVTFTLPVTTPPA